MPVLSKQVVQQALLSIVCLFLSSELVHAGVLDKVKQGNPIIIGYRTSAMPMSYQISNNVYGGYTVDICQRIIKRIGARYKLGEIKTTYIPVSAQSRMLAIQNGSIDMECASTTNNTARQKDVAFANTLFVEELRVAVLKQSNINHVQDLNNRQVVTTIGTTSVDYLKKHPNMAEVKFENLFAKDHKESLELVKNGRADAFVMDGSILAGLIANSSNPQDYKILTEVLKTEPTAIMLPKNDPEFLKAVNQAISEIVNAGEMPQIYSKWLEGKLPPKNVKISLPLSLNTEYAWKNLNNKPAEEYK